MFTDGSTYVCLSLLQCCDWYMIVAILVEKKVTGFHGHKTKQKGSLVRLT